MALCVFQCERFGINILIDLFEEVCACSVADQRYRCFRSNDDRTEARLKIGCGCVKSQKAEQRKKGLHARSVAECAASRNHKQMENAPAVNGWRASFQARREGWSPPGFSSKPT